MERRRRAANLDINNMEGDMLVARQQKWTGAGSGSGSGSSSSGSSSNSDSDSSSSKTIQYPPLRFTCDLDHFQFACKDIRLSFTGGCKPYSLSAFWFTDGNKDQATWVALKEETWDDSFQWSILAPVSSQLLFTITDAKGSTITSDDAINVLSNGKGMSQDTWCQYTYNAAPIPTADIDGSHKYAWNASSIDTDGDGDGDDGSASSATQVSATSDGMATSSFASKVTATNSVDTNATDLNDKSTTISKAIHDANQAKTIEGVLAALLGVSLIALFALLFLFIKTRRRLREARSQLATRLDAQGGGGQGGMMSEKSGGKPFRGTGAAAAGGGFYSPSSSGGAITPRAGRNGELRNPFDDASAAFMHPHPAHQQPRSPFLGSAADDNRARLSVTSLISAVPSSNAGRSTAGNSAISTEFYNTYKASTMPPAAARESGSSNPFGGVMRSLFAPMSFFSSATPSPNPSRAGSRSAASETGGDTSTLNTEYYGDRNGAMSRPETTRSTSDGTIHEDGISDSAITRQSTRSEFTSSSSGFSGNHLDPSSASSAGRSSATSRRSLSSSSGNGGDISSMAPSQSEDVYPDSDIASFSNFSFVDTRSIDFDDDARAKGQIRGGAGSSDEGSTTVVEHPRNPFREQSPGETFNKRRSWNQKTREYTELDKGFLGSTSSFGS